MTRLATDTQRSWASGEVAPEFYGRADLALYRQAAKSLVNFMVTRKGALRKRPGMEYCGMIGAGVAPTDDFPFRLVPFVFSGQQAYVLLVGAGATFVYYAGAQLLGAGDPAWDVATAYKLGDAVMDGATRYVAKASSTGLQPSANAAFWAATTALWIPNGYTAADLAGLRWAQGGDVLTLVHPRVPVIEYVRLAHQRWERRQPVLPVRSDPDEAVTALTAAYMKPAGLPNLQLPDYDDWHKPAHWEWTVTTVTKREGYWHESATQKAITPQAFISGNFAIFQDWWPIKLEWTPPADAGDEVYYRIYRGQDGVYGLVGECSAPPFLDRGKKEPDLSTQPPAPLEDDWYLLGNTDKYPGAVAYHDQRLVFGGSNSKPSAIWWSRAGQLYDFARNPFLTPLDTDGIALELAALHFERVRAIVPMRELVVFTSGAEWQIKAADGAFSSRSASARAHSHRGSGDLAPLAVGNSVLFASANGTQVYELAYDAQSESWADRDLTLLASHLFEGGRRIVDWCYQPHPESIIWCVLDDGALRSLTYVRQGDIVAWARHETHGTVRAVCCIPESGADVVYLLLERTLMVEGVAASALTLERMRDDGRVTDFARANFLDCSTRAWTGAAPAGGTLPLNQGGGTVNTNAGLTEAGGVYTFEAGGYTFTDLYIGWQIALLPGDEGASGMVVLEVAARTGDHTLTVTVVSGDPAAFLGVVLDPDHWLILADQVGGFERFEGAYPANALEAQPTVFADGTPAAAGVIAGGIVTLAAPAGWVVVGLPFDTDLEPLDIVSQAMKRKVLKKIGLHMDGAGFPALGTDLDHLTKPEDLEVSSNDPTTRTIARRIVDANVSHSYEAEARGALRQTKPFPLTILAVSREVDSAD